MGWNKFKELFKKGTRDEHYFILGLDIGASTSSIAFFDLNQNAPEIIDISGGYGKPSVPTVMQYVSETKEWVFGEYAMTNRTSEKDKTFHSLFEKLGLGEYMEISGKPVSVLAILSIYIKELIGNCKNINPRAEIAGIVVSIPSYFSEEARAELHAVFKNAGYEKPLLEFVDNRECILSRHYFGNEISKETALMVDFGAREIRAGLYEIEPNEKSDWININCRSFLFEKPMGTQFVDKSITDMFEKIYCSHFNLPAERLTQQQREQINIFSYQHKDLLFQKNMMAKPVKLYYNFAYPPFQATVPYEDIENIINPLKRKLSAFIMEVISKPGPGGKRSAIEDIKTVICVGGGFEMTWAKNAVLETLKDARVVFHKNSKGVAAEGASIVAAKELCVLPGKRFVIQDKNRINYDIGFKIIRDKRERFLPVVECNSFLWQEPLTKQFILSEPTDAPVNIEVFKREKDGAIIPLKNLTLEGLPPRPAGVTRLAVSLAFSNADIMKAKIKDMGFGELFPASDYENEFSLRL